MVRNANTVLFLVILISGCCNTGEYEPGGITVSYPALNDDGQLKAYIVRPANNYQIIDTISHGRLTELNDYTIFVNFEFYRDDQILFIEDTEYQDTITDISFDRSSCKKTIKNLEYWLNGEFRTDKTIIFKSN